MITIEWIYDDNDGWSHRGTPSPDGSTKELKSYSDPVDLGFDHIGVINGCQVWQRQKRPQFLLGIPVGYKCERSDDATETFLVPCAFSYIMVMDLPSLLDLRTKYNLGG